MYTLINTIQDWFREYTPESLVETAAIQNLLSEITTDEIPSLLSLQEIFSKHQKNKHITSSVQNKLKEWYEIVIKIEELYEQTYKNLDQLADYPITFFIKEVLELPGVLLMSDTKPLLAKIQDMDTLSKILGFLYDLPYSPLLAKPREGSFEAQLVQSKSHGHALQILRNNCAFLERVSRSEIKADHTADAANDLLQKLLMAHHNYYKAKPVSQRIEPASVPPQEGSSFFNSLCVLM